jgi:hypothetical protein
MKICIAVITFSDQPASDIGPVEKQGAFPGERPPQGGFPMKKMGYLEQKRLARLVLLALCTPILTFSWMGTAHAYEESYAFTKDQVDAGGPLLTWKSQTGAGMQSIAHDDEVVLSMTAPVISTSGSADAGEAFGYSAVTTDGTGAQFTISGTQGVTITSIGNPVITDDTQMHAGEDTQYKRTNVILARNKSSVSVSSTGGDITLNLADELTPDDRNGSYNLLIPFTNGHQSQLNVVLVESGSTVSLKGKNVYYF